MKKIIFYFAVLAVLSTGLAACETIKGAGRDLQAGGEAIEKAVEK